MAHDVFISYSKRDKPVADALCATLEAQRIRCWIAPRDILPGMDWSTAIIDAIDGCRIFVLVFSAGSNESEQVKREVQNAVSGGKPLLPFRIEDVPLSKHMRYFIGTPHWLDAMTPPLQQHLDRLAESVRALLRSGVAAGDRAGLPPEAPLNAGRDGVELGASPQQPVLEGALLERVAEAAHAVYVEAKQRDGWVYGPQRDNARRITPLLVPFEELLEHQKEKARDAVRQIPSLLSAAGHAMVPSRSNETPIEFPMADLEQLAELEHELWMEERLAAGFQPGVPTPEDPMRGEFLVPWADLPDEIKESYRRHVADIPRILARAGYAVKRLGEV